MISLLMGAAGGGPVTWDVGTVGRTFCIFMEGRKDLLGDMRLSREGAGRSGGWAPWRCGLASEGGVW